MSGFEGLPGFRDGWMMQTIRSSRVTMNPVGLPDLDALHAHYTEPGVRRWLLDGNVLSREQVREMIEKSSEMFREIGNGLWAVSLAGAWRVIGCAGFWHFHEPSELELVYSLSEAYWGRGLARHCAEMLIDYAFDALEWPHVQASADEPNEASFRVMRSVGMQPVGTRPGEFGSIQVFRITHAEWLEGLGRRHGR